MHTSISITHAEYRARAAKLVGHLQAQALTGCILFDRDYILYYSGFAFIPTERPIAFLVSTAGETALLVPRLELEHALSNGVADRVAHYDEYPATTHPMGELRDLCGELGISGRFGGDQAGYPWVFGYRGPDLQSAIGGSFNHVAAFIEDQMMIKSAAEINLIKESVRWGHLAHQLLQRYTRVGETETRVSLQASMDATLTMLDTIGPIYRAQGYFNNGAEAGYRGQIGRNAAIPHALANNIVFQPGDILVTGAGAPVWGYLSELERTMVIGKATDEQKRMFDHMLALQETAFAVMGPETPCSEVDHAVRAYYQAHDLMPFWKHHVGHAIGIRYHEAPFLDIGDATIMKPGMVFTVEPGLYASELGGFRHSDTVLITEAGIEILTYYPRDLASLTIPE